MPTKRRPTRRMTGRGIFGGMDRGMNFITKNRDSIGAIGNLFSIGKKALNFLRDSNVTTGQINTGLSAVNNLLGGRRRPRRKRTASIRKRRPQRGNGIWSILGSLL